MEKSPESYWRPQVLRHTNKDGRMEYAIHEVHFSEYGKKWGSTVDAVSDRFPSVKELREALISLVESNIDSVHCGDNQYEYFQDDFSLWLKHIDDQVLDYPDDNE